MKTNLRIQLKKIFLILILAMGVSFCFAQQNKSSGSNTLITLFTEDWSSSSFATNVWSFYPATTQCWVIQENYGNPPSSAEFSYYNAASEYDESLVSPLINVTALAGNDLFLKFEYYKESPYGWTSDSMAVEINNGAGWERISVFGGDEGGDQWSANSINISTFAMGNIFQFRFRCFGSDDAHYVWRIDNVTVCQAPISNLNGTVTHLFDGAPIKGATITASNTVTGVNTVTTTTANGTYILNGLEAGEYTITCNMFGYITISETITLGADQTTTKDFHINNPFVNIIEDWSSQKFQTNGWTFDPSQGNWGLFNWGNSEPGAVFYFEPEVINYNQSLVSASINATTLIDVMVLKYDIALQNNDNSRLDTMSVEVYNGTNWQTIKEYSNASGSFGWETDSINITSLVKGHNSNIRFRSHGENSSSIVGWGLDNINIIKICLGNIAGTVTKADDGSPLEGAVISLNNGVYSDTNDTNGNYAFSNIIEGKYFITCKKSGYMIITDSVSIPANNTLTKDFEMVSGINFTTNPGIIDVEVPITDILTQELTITNNGKSTFTWKSSIHSDEKAAAKTLSAMDTLFRFRAIGNNALETDGEYIYTCRENYSQFEKYDLNGNLIDGIGISQCFAWGMAYDGEYFYLASNNTKKIFKVDINNQANLDYISTPITYTKGITYDPKSDGFWISNDQNLYLINRKGDILKSNSFDGLTNIRGLAYDSWIPGGPYLLISDITGEGGIYQYDIAAGKLTGNSYKTSLLDMSLSDKIIPGKVVLIGYEPHSNDIGYVIGLDMGPSSRLGSWASMSPASGALTPGESQKLTVAFDGNYILQENNHKLTGNINFTSSPDVGAPVVPISMTITGKIYGTLSGITTHGSSPLEGVTVKAYRKEAPAYNYIAITKADGSYSFPSAIIGNYTICATREGYTSSSAKSIVTGGEITTADFIMLAPSMNTDLTSINDSITLGGIKTRTIHIENNGDGALTWNSIISQTTGKLKVSIPASDGQFRTGISVASIKQVAVADALTSSGTSGYVEGSSVAYGFNPRGNGKSIFLKFDPENPSETVMLANLNFQYQEAPQCATFGIATDSIYTLNMSNDAVKIFIKKIDVASGNYRTVGRVYINSDQTPVSLTCDKTTGILYAAVVKNDLTQSYLCRVNPNTGNFTYIGATNTPALISITVDGTGQIYGYDIIKDSAYKINKLTGASTRIGSIGFDANNLQGFSWDPATDNIYMMAFNSETGPEMRIFDKTTGNTQMIGTPVYVNGLSFAGGVPKWLSVEPVCGTIAVGSSQDITVTLDGNYLPYQDQADKSYTLNGSIVISPLSNTGNTNIPVTFKIMDNIGLLNGTVTYNGKALEGITVKAVREGNILYAYTKVTGVDGKFDYDAIMCGNYTVSVSADGYNTYTSPVYVAGNGQAIVNNIVLTRPSMDMDIKSIDETIMFGEVVTKSVSITNNGNGPMTWNGITTDSNKKKKATVSIPRSDGNFERGSAPASIGFAPGRKRLTSTSSAGMLLEGDNAFAFDANSVYNIFSFNTSDPSTRNFIGSNWWSTFAGAFDGEHEDFMYIADLNDNYLKTIDVATGDVVKSIGYLSAVNYGQSWIGLHFDKTTGILYGATTDASESYIYTINPETAETNWIGSQTTGIPGLIDIAIDNKGQMYGYDIIGDNAYSIDKNTGTSKLLGPIGFDANYSQGMAYDPVNNLIYLAAYNNTNNEGELRLLDPSTGNTKLLGSFGVSVEVDAFAFPGKVINWLSIEPKTGTIPAGESKDVTVTLNGNYTSFELEYPLTGNILFNPSPNVGNTDIPVTLNVFTETPAAALTITTVTPTQSGAFAVPVHARNFVNLGSFSFTIGYDPAILSYASISDWYSGVKGVTIDNSIAGKITCSWVENSNGIDIVDDATLFNINFNWVNSTVAQTLVSWSDSPTQRAFADYNGKGITPGYTNGTVVVGFTGIPEDEASSIKVFPNPATNFINIEFPSDITKIEVLNSLGIVIYSENVLHINAIKLKTTTYSSGSYLIRFITSNGRSLLKKVVVRK